MIHIVLLNVKFSKLKLQILVTVKKSISQKKFYFQIIIKILHLICIIKYMSDPDLKLKIFKILNRIQNCKTFKQYKMKYTFLYTGTRFLKYVTNNIVIENFK